jgi:hypothetical protein
MPASAPEAQRLLFCTFASDQPGEESRFPQMRGLSSDASFKESYWQCMAVLFTSFRAYDLNTSCMIITNEAPDRYCPRGLLSHLDKINVRTELVPFSGSRNKAVKSFGNVCYLFDALANLAKENKYELYFYLDADCIVINNPAPVWRALSDRKLLFYNVGTSPHEEIASLSLDDLTSFALRQGWRLQSPLRHVGGEFLALTAEELHRLLAVVHKLRAADTNGILTMEEHLLSLAVSILGRGDNSFNDHIRRIWTGPRRKDARQSDVELTIWHAPREKQFGFSQLYADLATQEADAGWAGMPEGRYRAHVAERLGVPRWSARKWARELPQLVWRR